MPQPIETLIFVHRLKKAELQAVYAHSSAFPAAGLRASLLEATEEVCLDRLIRADGCLRLARQLAQWTGEEELRAGIGRAYYSAHHSLRSMSQWYNKWDPDGHQESIKAFKALLTEVDFLRKSGLAVGAEQRVEEAQTNRHIADYSPYDIQRDPPDVRWLRLTNGNWSEALRFNISVADELLQAAVRFVGS